MVDKIVQGLDVTVEAVTLDRADAGGADIGDLTEFLSRIGIGKMHLDGGDAHGLYGVEQGNAGVGVGRGIDDDAVDAPIGLLNGVDEVAFVIGLLKLHGHIVGFRFRGDG